MLPIMSIEKVGTRNLQIVSQQCSMKYAPTLQRLCSYRYNNNGLNKNNFLQNTA